MENIEELLNNISTNSILTISSWGGLGPTPGESGIIITENKVYRYAKYHHIEKFHKDEIHDFINEIKVTNKQLELIKDYIESNFKDKESSYQMMFDADFILKINYKDINIKIVNNFNLYKKTYDDIHNILGGL